MKVSFLYLALILTLVGVPQDLFARTYSFTEKAAIKAIDDGFASKLREDDVLQVKLQSGKVKEITLGSYVDEGATGVVYRVKDSFPPQVIKIPKGGPMRANMFALEYNSLKQIRLSSIPHASLQDGHPKIFMLKPYIEGKTLSRHMALWNELTPYEQGELISSMREFFKDILKSGIKLSDVNPANVIFNEKTRHWVIIDFVRAMKEGPVEDTLTYVAEELRRRLSLKKEWTDDLKFLADYFEAKRGLEAPVKLPCLAKQLNLR